jgi:hypothetical protein
MSDRFLFLDIDDVFNTHHAQTQQNGTRRYSPDDPGGMLDPAAVWLFCDWLEGQDLNLVLSSTWRHHYTLEEVRDAFREHDPRFPDFFGKTGKRHPRFSGFWRDIEILDWLCTNGYRTETVRFAVLDDWPGYGSGRPNLVEPVLVRVHPLYGLTASDLYRVDQCLRLENPLAGIDWCYYLQESAL